LSAVAVALLANVSRLPPIFRRLSRTKIYRQIKFALIYENDVIHHFWAGNEGKKWIILPLLNFRCKNLCRFFDSKNKINYFSFCY
jgi:hypothetical protein